jgi:hypothetical protein
VELDSWTWILWFPSFGASERKIIIASFLYCAEGESNVLWQCAAEELRLDCGSQHLLVIMGARLVNDGPVLGSQPEVTECARKLNATRSRKRAASHDDDNEEDVSNGLFSVQADLRRQILAKYVNCFFAFSPSVLRVGLLRSLYRCENGRFFQCPRVA